MSMAARAINSRAVSSTSFSGMGRDTCDPPALDYSIAVVLARSALVWSGASPQAQDAAARPPRARLTNAQPHHVEGRGDVRRELGGPDRACARVCEDRGDEGGRPGPHAEELPGVKGIAEDEADRRPVPEHGRAEALPLAPRVEDVGRRPECQP